MVNRITPPKEVHILTSERENVTLQGKRDFADGVKLKMGRCWRGQGGLHVITRVLRGRQRVGVRGETWCEWVKLGCWPWRGHEPRRLAPVEARKGKKGLLPRNL